MSNNNRSSGVNQGGKDKSSQFSQTVKRQRTSGNAVIPPPVSSVPPLQSLPSNLPFGTKLEKYTLAAPEVVILNHRIGHPDFFPLYAEPHDCEEKAKFITLSKHAAPEDTFAVKSISEGFTDPAHLQDEYGSMKNKLGSVNIHEIKGKALKSIKEIEWFKGMSARKLTKSSVQMQKKATKFPSQIPCKKEFMDKWMQGLASGEPLHKLAQRVPLGHKGDNLLQALARERVPLLRATWLIKIIHQNNIQKKSETELSVEWTICLISGLISNMKMLVANVELLEKHKSPFLYVLSLMNWNFYEGLLHSETLFSKLLEAFHDANKLEEVSLWCCILTTYISQITFYPQFTKQLIQIVMEKTKLVDESSHLTPEKLPSASRNQQLDESTLIQFVHASALDILDTLRCMLHEILLDAPTLMELFDPQAKGAILKTLQTQVDSVLDFQNIPNGVKLPFFALISPVVTHGFNELAFSNGNILPARRNNHQLSFVEQLNFNIDFFQALEDFVRLIWTGSVLNPEFVADRNPSPDFRMRKLLEQYQLLGYYDITENNMNLWEFTHVVCAWVVTGDQGDDGLLSIRSLLASSLLSIVVQSSNSTQDFLLQEPVNMFLKTSHAQSNIEKTSVLLAHLIRRHLFSHDIFVRHLISKGIMEERDIGQKFSTYVELIHKLPVAVDSDLLYLMHQPSYEISDAEEQFQHLQNQRRSILHSVPLASELNEEANQIFGLEQSVEQLLKVASESDKQGVGWFVKDDLTTMQFSQTLDKVCAHLHSSSLYIRFSIAQRLLLLSAKKKADFGNGNIPTTPSELLVLVKLLTSCEDWITLSQVLCVVLSCTPADSTNPLLWSIIMLNLWFIKRYENVFILADLTETFLEIFLTKCTERAKFSTDVLCQVLCSHFVLYNQGHDDVFKKFSEKYSQQLSVVQHLALPVVDFDITPYLSNLGVSANNTETLVHSLLLSTTQGSNLMHLEWLLVYLTAFAHAKYLSSYHAKIHFRQTIHTNIINFWSAPEHNTHLISLLKILGQQFGLEFVLPVFTEMVQKHLPLKAESDLRFVSSLLKVIDDVLSVSEVLIVLHPISFVSVYSGQSRPQFWSTIFDSLAAPIMDTYFSDRCTEDIQQAIALMTAKPWFKQIWKAEKSAKYAISNFNKTSTLISSLLPNFKQPFQTLHQTNKKAQSHTLEFASTLANCTILNWKVNCLYLLALVHCPICKAEQSNPDNRTKELVVQIILFSMGLVLDLVRATTINMYSYKETGQHGSQKNCVISCRVIRAIGINLTIHTTMFRVVDDILQSNLKTKESLLQTTLNLVKQPQEPKDFVGSKSEEFVNFVLSWLAICSSDLQLIRLFVHSLANQLRELVTNDFSAMDDSQATHVNECIAIRLQLLEPLLGFLKKGKTLDSKLITDIATPLFRFLQSSDPFQKHRSLFSQIGPRLVRIFELLLSWTEIEFSANPQLVECRDQFKVDFQEFVSKQKMNGGQNSAIFFAMEEALPWLAMENLGSMASAQSVSIKKRVLEDTWAMLEDVEEIPLSPCSVLGAVYVDKTKASSFYLHPT